jgi:hypothetical protein
MRIDMRIGRRNRQRLALVPPTRWRRHLVGCGKQRVSAGTVGICICIVIPAVAVVAVLSCCNSCCYICGCCNSCGCGCFRPLEVGPESVVAVVVSISLGVLAVRWRRRRRLEGIVPRNDPFPGGVGPPAAVGRRIRHERRRQQTTKHNSCSSRSRAVAAVEVLFCSVLLFSCSLKECFSSFSCSCRRSRALVLLFRCIVSII